MHGALLPMHDQFLPKHNAKRGPFQQLWAHVSGRSGKKRQTLLVRVILGGLALLAVLRLFLHTNIFINENVDVYYDFSQQHSSAHSAANNKERVLICIPLRNAEDVLDLMWGHLDNLTYPHELLDLAFLVSDCTDRTSNKLSTTAQKHVHDFGSIDIFMRDFGAKINQDVDARHGVHVQAERRKLMGRARNWLVSAALKPHHSWVYWRDADIERSPPDLIQDLMKHDRDVIVPNVWRPLPKYMGGQQPYDLNSWIESDMALELAETLNEDDVIVEGYAEYPTYRYHLAYARNDDGTGDMNDVLDLDGIGGVSIMSKAKVFRAGMNFPGFAFLNHAETEAFGKMCRQMGFSVSGLTQYTIWHKYEPSTDDLLEFAERTKAGLPID